MTTTYRTAAEVAKLVRAEIKAAVAAGELPADVKYRVRSESFSGGQAVNIFAEMPEERAWVPTEPTDPEFLSYRMETKLSAEVRAIGAKLNAIAAPHRSAYFYVNPYLNGGTCI